MHSQAPIHQTADLLKKIMAGNDVAKAELRHVFQLILDHQLGEANETSFGALFAALQTKGPTVEEIAALTEVVLDYDRITIEYEHVDELCGIVGTGKDDLKTFNISTGAAIVAAAAGAKVVKNGSRSESSIAGTTDVLEYLGVNVQAKPETIVRTLAKVGLTFCDAEPFFPRMGKEYVGKFIFPHPLSYTLSIASGLSFGKMIFGSSFADTELIAAIIKELGIKQFMVVAGHDHQGKTLDEISTVGPTMVTEYINQKFRTYQLLPSDIGLKEATFDDIKQGKSVAENAHYLQQIIIAKEPGPRKDIVVLNAGALLYVDGKAATIEQGIEQATHAIEAGKAEKVLTNLIELTNE